MIGYIILFCIFLLVIFFWLIRLKRLPAKILTSKEEVVLKSRKKKLRLTDSIRKLFAKRKSSHQLTAKIKCQRGHYKTGAEAGEAIITIQLLSGKKPVSGVKVEKVEVADLEHDFSDEPLYTNGDGTVVIRDMVKINEPFLVRVQVRGKVRQYVLTKSIKLRAPKDKSLKNTLYQKLQWIIIKLLFSLTWLFKNTWQFIWRLVKFVFAKIWSLIKVFTIKLWTFIKFVSGNIWQIIKLAARQTKGLFQWLIRNHKYLLVGIVAGMVLIAIGVFNQSLILTWLGTIILMFFVRTRKVLIRDGNVTKLFKGLPWPQFFAIIAGLWIIIYLL
jgi:hypothetical protein